MKYKVFFHRGNDLTVKTRVERGYVWLDDNGLNIDGPGGQFSIPKTDLLSVELFRLHGLGRVIRIQTRSGHFFVSVVRFMIGQFAAINFFKTGTLHERLRAMVRVDSMHVVEESN
jgi:hypothetical protein